MESKRILVVTSTKGFGELIKQTLEESGRFSVTLVDNAGDAIQSARRESCVLSILDSAVEGGYLDDLADHLRAAQPELKLVLIPPENDTTSPIMGKIAPDGYLTKPFYLPDLFDTIAEVLSSPQVNEAAKKVSTEVRPAGTTSRHEMHSSHPLEWLEDVNLAAQHLTRLSLESAAHAALIVRENQLWAYAGQFTEQATNELAEIIDDFWQNDDVDSGSSDDKVRFIRLQSTANEYLLYVTALGDEMLLALVFDTETPFSKIRSQAAKLARSLSSPPNHITNMAKTNWNTQEQWAQELEDLSSSPLPDIRPLLHSMSPPSPDGISNQQTPRIKKNDLKTGFAEINPEPGAVSHTNLHPGITRTPEKDTIKPQLVGKDVAPIKAEDLRPVTPAMHYLNFACLLVPRIPSHHLTGELASSLSKWLNQLCLAYGWRLEHQSIRPGYLLWIANISPSTSPSTHIRLIRKQTSARIYKAFPHYSNENPSGDFWAPGYLIVSGPQPPAADIINQFIYNSRQHQGL